jgi:hypothetical protein
VQRLRPELWEKKKPLNHDNAPFHASFFTREFFYRKQHNCRPPPTLIFCYSDDDKTERPPFYISGVIQAESQAVLNTLTEHDFEDAFKTGRSAGNGAYARKGTTSRVVVVSRHKVSF